MPKRGEKPSFSSGFSDTSPIGMLAGLVLCVPLDDAAPGSTSSHPSMALVILRCLSRSFSPGRFSTDSFSSGEILNGAFESTSTSEVAFNDAFEATFSSDLALGTSVEATFSAAPATLTAPRGTDATDPFTLLRERCGSGCRWGGDSSGGRDGIDAVTLLRERWAGDWGRGGVP